MQNKTINKHREPKISTYKISKFVEVVENLKILQSFVPCFEKNTILCLTREKKET